MKIALALIVLAFTSASFANLETPDCDRQIVHSLASVDGAGAVAAIQMISLNLLTVDNLTGEKIDAALKPSRDSAANDLKSAYQNLLKISPAEAAYINQQCKLNF